MGTRPRSTHAGRRRRLLADSFSRRRPADLRCPSPGNHPTASVPQPSSPHAVVELANALRKHSCLWLRPVLTCDSSSGKAEPMPRDRHGDMAAGARRVRPDRGAVIRRKAETRMATDTEPPSATGITGPPGVYSVLNSTNLTTWSVMGVVSNPLGSVNFHDVTTKVLPQKFYRVLLR